MAGDSTLNFNLYPIIYKNPARTISLEKSRSFYKPQVQRTPSPVNSRYPKTLTLPQSSHIPSTCKIKYTKKPQNQHQPSSARAESVLSLYTRGGALNRRPGSALARGSARTLLTRALVTYSGALAWQLCAGAAAAARKYNDAKFPDPILSRSLSTAAGIMKAAGRY